MFASQRLCEPFKTLKKNINVGHRDSEANGGARAFGVKIPGRFSYWFEKGDAKKARNNELAKIGVFKMGLNLKDLRKESGNALDIFGREGEV